MYSFNIQSLDWYCAFFLGFSGNQLNRLYNIPTAFGIISRVHGWKCIIYAWLIVFNLHIGTKLCCGGGKLCKSLWSREGVIEVIGWWIILILALFYVCELVCIWIYKYSVYPTLWLCLTFGATIFLENIYSCDV